jgi:RNA recognition motif-containing protein
MDEQFFSGVFNNLGYGSLLTKIKIMKSKHPGNLKNFGFLEFNNRSTALNVL